MAIIEFARNQLNLKKATSSEFDKKGLPIIGLINEWTKDGRKIKGTDNNLRTVIELPNGNGKKVKIAVLCDDSKLSDAKK